MVVAEREKTEELEHKLEDWMTASEVAQWLGITERRLAVNRIPCAMIGPTRFYKKQDVAAWLQRKRDTR